MGSQLRRRHAEDRGAYIPSAFLRLLHALQYCGHFIPSWIFPAALSAFHSAPHARSRAIMASRPGDGFAAGAAAGVVPAAGGAAGAGAAAAGAVPAAGGVSAAGAASPDMHCLLK